MQSKLAQHHAETERARLANPTPAFERALLELAAAMPPRITLRQVIAFVEIARTPGISLSDLQAVQHAGEPIIGQSITRSHIALIDLGLITADRSADDKRAVSLVLTDKGRELFVRAMKPIGDFRTAKPTPYRSRRP